MASDTTQQHILCINHAPEILDLLSTLLEEEGYRVTTQHAIDHSLDSIVELAPDAITVDYMWSTSDNEWTYLNLLRLDPRTRHIPVVLCTAAVGKAIEMQTHLDSMGVKVVFKPFDIEDLLSAVQASLTDRSIDKVLEAPVD